MANAQPGEINPATLGIRLLALLENASQRAGKGVVHRLRTTVRRLEVHLGTPPPRVGRSLKKLRKKAGKVRDIDVHLGLLQPPLLRSGGRASDPAKARDQQKLQSVLQKRRKSKSRALRRLVKDSTPLLEAHLPALVEQRSDPSITLQESRKRASRARHRFLQWTNTIPDNPQRLHQLRINAKKLRYEMEALQNCEEAIELVEKFKQVQDTIGQWHDWATLAELAEQCLNSKKSPDSSDASPVLHALHARVQREYRKARRSAEAVRNWITGSTAGKASHPDQGGRRSASAVSTSQTRASMPPRKGPANAGGGPRLVHRAG